VAAGFVSRFFLGKYICNEYEDREDMNMDPVNEEPTLNEIQRDENGGSKRPSGLIIGGVVVVALLIIIGLFLPPISLGERLGLGGGDEEAMTATTDGEEMAAGDSSLSVPGEITLTVADGSPVTVNATTIEEFIQTNANAAMPEGTAVQGNIYAISYEGTTPTGQAALTIPESVAAETLDLYGWNGESWGFIPSQVDTAEQQIESTEGLALPQAYALVVLGESEYPEIGTAVDPGQELAPELLPLLTKVTVNGLTLADGGALEGETQPLPDGPYDQYVSATNVGAIIDQENLSAMLNDANAQAAQLGALASVAVSGDYAGVNLDYQEVSSNDREAFTQFVSALAETLAQQDMDLALTLGTPEHVGNTWDTGGQDWAALGQIADYIFVKMPAYPEAYLENGTAEQMLDWAVRQIPRHKLIMLLSANAVSGVGEFYQELSNAEALSSFGTLEFVQGSETVEPETAVEVALSGTADPLEWDGNSLTYKYSYVDENGQTHEVWLANAAALANRTHLADGLNLGGISVSGLGELSDGIGYVAAISSYLTDGAIPSPESAAIAWTVRDSSDSVVASATGEDLTFAWEGSANAGDYTIQADFALGENVVPLDAVTIAVGELVEEEEEVAEEEPAESASAENPNATVNVASNIRYGPGVTYGIIANGLQAGTRVQVIGRDEGSTWLNIITPNGDKAWIFATLLTLDPGVDIASLPIGEATDAPVASGGDTDSTTTTGGPPPPVAAGPVTNAGFELGGQSHTFANPQLMSSAGMNWIKFQHKWGPGGKPSDVADRINRAHAAGFKVLLSIPGANTYPDSIAFQEYVQFLGGVAALGPDAIEVWNEMNIDFEWPAGQIDPTSYVNNMLAPAYNAIKSANSNVMVVSGAPAPTGFDNNTNAWADSRYMAGMAAAGAANYLDCVGAHYNAGATSPSQVTGHPAGSDHYSWYFLPTLNVYAQLGKPVCFTELGYLSGQDYGGVPDRFSWASNTTVDQHAAWLAEAVSLAANSGQVRMVIVFNVDFTQWGSDPQAGFAMIRKGGNCPACATLASVMGR
jgi:hypothetical protein